ncbi:hypothetical protein BJ912DRAFT_469380 [Pholiota molesta]|nr:hypothetical protein BJ912DRAFT_469380 [Pholiota molesta]
MDPTDAIPLIIVLGDGGVGKSTFIKVAGSASDLGKKPEISHGIHPGTTTPQECAVRHPKKPEFFVRLIDTPGFDEGKESGIIEWLEALPNARLAGILVLHDVHRCKNSHISISASKLSEMESVCVQVFTKIGGEDPVSYENCWNQISAVNGQVKLFEGTLVSAWDILDGVCSGPPINRTTGQLADTIEKYYALYGQNSRKRRTFLNKMFSLWP